MQEFNDSLPTEENCNVFRSCLLKAPVGQYLSNTSRWLLVAISVNTQLMSLLFQVSTANGKDLSFLLAVEIIFGGFPDQMSILNSWISISILKQWGKLSISQLVHLVIYLIRKTTVTTIFWMMWSVWPSSKFLPLTSVNLGLNYSKLFLGFSLFFISFFVLPLI